MSVRKASIPVDDEPPSKKLRLASDAHYLEYTTLGSFQSPPPVPFQQPLPLLTFSYTPEHVLEFTDSALRYYVDPPGGAHLAYGYERWVRKPEERGRLDSLLRGWSQVGGGKDNTSGVKIVSWRGVLTKILTAVYENQDEWEMNVMCVNGTMYFEEHLTEGKLREKENLKPRHRLQTYYGYAFESYCTSTTPDRPLDHTSAAPGWGGDVDTNVQWCVVAKTKLGSNRIVLGGEVDCVRGKYNGSTDVFVELKTSMTIRNQQDEAKFRRKLLKYYFQSFLLGVPRIMVGFRTAAGRISKIQCFKTLEIPRLVRGKENAWDPLLCLAWADKLFTFLVSIVSGPEGLASRVWRVKFIPRQGVKVWLLNEDGVKEVESGEERAGFLPKWYLNGEKEPISGSASGIAPSLVELPEETAR